MTVSNGLGTTGNGVGTVTPGDHKLAQSGLIVKTGGASNAVRAGVFYTGTDSIVTGTSGMTYDVGAFTAALSRGGSSGTVLLANDGTVNIATTAAPGSNSRIDTVYVWQREFVLDGVDSEPVIGVAQGTAAASPVAPSLAAFPGAVALANITVPAGVTATNTGTTIAQVAPFTAAAGGMIAFRSTAERDAATVHEGQLAWLISAERLEQFDGSTWHPSTVQFGYYQGTVGPATGVDGDIASTASFVRGTALTQGTNALIANVSGWYEIEATISWTANSTGSRVADVTVNNADMTFPLGSRRNATGNSRVTMSGVRYLTATDVLRLRVQQDSGTTLTATGTLSVKFLSLGSAPA